MDSMIHSVYVFLSQLLTSPAFFVLWAMFALGAAVEACFSGRTFSWRDRALNFRWAFCYSLLEFMLASFKASVVAGAVRIFGQAQALSLQVDFENRLLQSAAAVGIALAASDFFLYWMHRLEHRIPWLWDEHIVHHCDERVTIFSTARLHPINLLIRPVLVSAPLAVLVRLPAPELALLGLVPYLWIYVIHLDIRLGFGPAWWLLTSPQYHLIHHSDDERHRNRNFAAFFPLWDIIFGTAYRPGPREYPEPGIRGLHVGTVFDALMLPFRRWGARVRGHLGTSPPTNPVL